MPLHNQFMSEPEKKVCTSELFIRIEYRKLNGKPEWNIARKRIP